MQTEQLAMVENGHRWRSVIVMVLLVPAVAACSGSLPDLGLSRPEWHVSANDRLSGRSLTQADLIGADGRCADLAAPGSSDAGSSTKVLSFTAGPQANPQVTPQSNSAAPPTTPGAAGATRPAERGVALGMSECDVVRIAGYTDRIELVANERGQRRVVLTYAQGPHAGIYRFVSGRLTSIERGAEAPAPAKPTVRTKKKSAASQQ
jgi:hypothetical protein